MQIKEYLRIKKVLSAPIQITQLIVLYLSFLAHKVNKKHKYKYILGVHEIANYLNLLAKVFSSCCVVNFSTNKFYPSNKYNYQLNIDNKYLRYLIRLIYGPYLLGKLANQSDVFIYVWGSGFCADRRIDFNFLKSIDKKIVCIFLGDDIRSRKLLLEYCKENDLDTYIEYDSYPYLLSESSVQKTALDADNYADIIFSHPVDQISYLESLQLPNCYTFEDSLFNKNTVKFKNVDQLVVVHAPSSPIIKGTPLVRAAIKRLKLEGYNFEYLELVNKTNNEVLSILESSHIVLNQFYAFMPGMFGVEAMANYNAVLMSCKAEHLVNCPEETWMETGYWELYDNLKILLDNPNLIEEYAKKSYQFVYENYRESATRGYYESAFRRSGIIK